MEQFDSFSQQIIQIKGRNYVCPCGKAYLSNAALFTHVKQKHQGKAPGPVSKPKSLYQKRGRPSLATKRLKNKQLKKNIQTKESSSVKNDMTVRLDYKDKFEQIFMFLQEIEPSQVIDNKIWTQVQVFKEIYKYLDNPDYSTISILDKKQPFRYIGVRMAIGITQFLRFICFKVQKYQFQQIFVGIMLLVQYVVDENNRKEIIIQAPVQFLIGYVNNFVNNQLQNLRQDFQVNNLWIMKRKNIIKVIYCFINWLIYKNYTVYCVKIDEKQFSF